MPKFERLWRRDLFTWSRFCATKPACNLEPCLDKHNHHDRRMSSQKSTGKEGMKQKSLMSFFSKDSQGPKQKAPPKTPAKPTTERKRVPETPSTPATPASSSSLGDELLDRGSSVPASDPPTPSSEPIDVDMEAEEEPRSVRSTRQVSD